MTEPKYPKTQVWIKKLVFTVVPYTLKYYEATRKKTNAVCGNLDEIGGYRAEQNKPDTERLIQDSSMV